MISCDICGINSKSMRMYLVHMSYHRHVPVSFRCKYEQCVLVFKSYNRFKKHVTENHSDNSRSKFFPRNISCTLKNCKFYSKNKTGVNRHICLHLRGGSTLECPYYEFCKAKSVFKTVAAFKKHLIRNHF